MGANRARANEYLYRAGLLLEGWARCSDAGSAPDMTLRRAFAPAVLEALRASYGWFLLDVVVAEGAASPPRSTDELPSPAPGKAVPGEIREFAQLEARGFLSEMLQPLPSDQGSGTPKPQGQLLSVDTAGWPSREDCAHWRESLARIYARMSDSLDEC